MSNLKWQTIPAIEAPALDQARQQVHAAIQLVASVGRSFLPQDDQDAMANLSWSGALDAMLGRMIGEVQVGLKPADLTLLMVKRGGVVASLPLSGLTWQEAFDWLRAQMSAARVDASQLSDQRPYELPAYPPLRGEPFILEDGAACDALRKYYANADLELRALSQHETGASEVKIWPHHFDIATLITVEGQGSGKFIGAGMSPGDGAGGYEQPYFYVNLWPAPALPLLDLPDFPLGGHWHREGWVGAVLPHQTLISTLSYDQQQQMTEQFLTQAVQVNRGVLAGE
jgi:hypothetical protein